MLFNLKQHLRIQFRKFINTRYGRRGKVGDLHDLWGENWVWIIIPRGIWDLDVGIVWGGAVSKVKCGLKQHPQPCM